MLVISDGSVKGPFIGVDATPGSELDRMLDQTFAGYSGSSTESFLRFARDFFPASERNRELDQKILSVNTLKDLTQRFQDAGRFTGPGNSPLVYPVGTPLASGHRIAVKSLVDMIRDEELYCIQKVLFISYLLKKRGITHRIVNGKTETQGHIWIELKNGRILDPTWRILVWPKTTGALSGWKRHDKTYVTEMQIYPYLDLTL